MCTRSVIDPIQVPETSHSNKAVKLDALVVPVQPRGLGTSEEPLAFSPC